MPNIDAIKKTFPRNFEVPFKESHAENKQPIPGRVRIFPFPESSLVS